MYWLLAGLLILGAVCGATVRLMVFVGVLLGGAVIAVLVGAAHGAGAALLSAVIAVVCLQVGYAAGIVLRAAIRSLHPGTAGRGSGEQPLSAPVGQKRR
jgi:hypothetical protein